MSKKILRLKEEDLNLNPEDQQKQLDLQLQGLQQKKKDLEDGVQKSQSMANNAKRLTGLPSGLNDKARQFDKQVNTNIAQKNSEEMRFNREEIEKVDQQIASVTDQLANMKANKSVVTTEQILRMIESQEPARMKKRELIETISNQLLTEDMNDELKDKIDSGDNDYAKHLDPETVKRMADSIMVDVRANLVAKMGGRGNVNLENATRTLAQGLTNALMKEDRHKPELERLAVQMVSEEYGIPEGAVDFDAKITGQEPIRKTGLKLTKGNKRPPQGKTEEELKPNVTKRRLMNAMMHGAARKGQYMYHMAQERLNRIAPGLTDDYSKIMAGNDFMYWALDDNTISQESEEGAHAGQVRVDLSGPRPKIIAQGMTFPFLIHELTKGVLELMSLHGLDADKETREYVLDKTDNLESEPWDIRLGPKIWEKFMEALDVDDLPNKSQIFNKISTLPPAEFNALVQGLMNDSEQARRTVRDIASDTRRELGDEALDTATSQYRDDDNGGEEGGLQTPEGDEDQEDPVLKGLLGGKDKPEAETEEEVSNPETWTKRELETEIDAALDVEDYETVRMLTDILNRKY